VSSTSETATHRLAHQVEDIHVSYGAKRAVDGVSLEINEGEIFGPSRWSPGGTVATLLSGAMQPAAWSADTWWAFLASVGYAVVFAGIGIRWFQWSTR
jgi:ABC-type uncharacterized transport system ATPase subunit